MVAICSGSSIVPFRYTSPNAHIFDFLDVHPVVFSINVISCSTDTVSLYDTAWIN